MQKKSRSGDQGYIMVKRLTLTIPPLRGPDPQGLNIPSKQVKTIKLEKLNGRSRQHRQGIAERRTNRN